MERIKAKIKKNRFIYIVLLKIYRNLISPIKSGLVWFYIKYLIFVKRKDIDGLKKLGFIKISQYKIKQWRFGKGKDGAYRRYYKGIYDGKQAFIKVAKYDSTIKNEIQICMHLQTENIDFIPKMIVARENFYNSTDVLAIVYLEGLNEFSTPQNYGDFENICKQMLCILKKLKEYEIVHADIHKGNLMLNKDKKIVLLDFGISICKNVKNNVNYIARPGTFFVEEGGIRKYDDAYSFIKMLEQWDIDCSWKNCEAYKQIEDLVGKNYATIYVK